MSPQKGEKMNTLATRGEGPEKKEKSVGHWIWERPRCAKKGVRGPGRRGGGGGAAIGEKLQEILIKLSRGEGRRVLGPAQRRLSDLYHNREENGKNFENTERNAGRGLTKTKDIREE